MEVIIAGGCLNEERGAVGASRGMVPHLQQPQAAVASIQNDQLNGSTPWFRNPAIFEASGGRHDIYEKYPLCHRDTYVFFTFFSYFTLSGTIPIPKSILFFKLDLFYKVFRG
jgi:hypothetical protein